MEKGELYRIGANYGVHPDIVNKICILGDVDSIDPNRFYWHPSDEGSRFVIILENVMNDVIPRFAHIKRTNLQELSAHELAQAHIKFGDLINRYQEVVSFTKI